jgi:formate-dependent nitrite reductase membrane component NrfD
MLEEILVTPRANPKIDPVLSIWTWEISAYLFIGGLTAGIMFFAGFMILSKREAAARVATMQLPLWAPIVLSLGMLMLFLDLERKIMVWRFYTTFQPTSPMSWGSWVLLLVYPASILLILTYIRQGYPRLAALLEGVPYGKLAIDLTERWRTPIAWANIVLAVFLGIYTGILLSAFSARPFWNTGLLGPLFLVSGLSAAAALTVLGARMSEESHLFARIDVGLVSLELIIIALLLISLASGNQVQLAALGKLFGGNYTLIFWGGLIGFGLAAPLLLELVGFRWHQPWLLWLPPVMVLIGGYLLRHIAVNLGQDTTWVDYANPYNTELWQLIPRH